MKKFTSIVTCSIMLGFCLSANKGFAIFKMGDKIELICTNAAGRVTKSTMATCANSNGCTEADVIAAHNAYCSNPNWNMGLVTVGSFSEYHGDMRHSNMAGGTTIVKTSAYHYQAFWQTQYEETITSFQILYSFDHANWTVLTTVNALGYSQQIRTYNTAVQPIQVPGNTATVYFKVRLIGSNGEVGFIEGVYEEAGAASRLASFGNPEELASSPGEISLFPNPTIDQCFINFGDISEQPSQQVEIYDLAGKLVLSQHCSLQQVVPVDLKGFKEGIYFVNITNGQMAERKKLVKIAGN